MKYKLKTAIEITESHVKWVQTTTKKNPVVVHCDIKEISQPSDSEITKILAAMAAAARIKSNYIIGVIPRRFAILRHLVLPSHDPIEIGKMVSLQITKQVPYPKEDIVLDYTILEKEQSGYARVLITAVHREAIDRYLKIFNAAGLIIRQLSLSSVSLLNWILYREQRSGEKNKNPIAVIHIDTFQTDLCFCHNEKLLFSRSISFGARDLTGENIHPFLEDITLTLETYVKEKIGEAVSKIIIIAATQEVIPLKERLEENYKIPLVIINPWEGIPQKKDLKWPAGLNQAGVSPAVCLGLLFGSERRLANLMPSEVINTQENKRKQKEWIQLLFFLGAIFILMTAIFAVRLYKDSLYLAQLQKELAYTEHTVKDIETKEMQLQFIQKRLNPSLTILDVIHELYRLTPQDVYFSLLTLDEADVLTLRGVASSGVNSLQKSLAASPLFKNVTLKYATKRKILKGELTDFEITCQILREKEGEKKK